MAGYLDRPGDRFMAGRLGFRRLLPMPTTARPGTGPGTQVIVIYSDGQGRMKTAEAPADYSYVKGCHAIANGYHCDAPTATP
jgi:hypothetical protein